MYVKAPRGRLVHFAYPDIESGWEDVPLKNIGVFGGWSSFSMCGQGWNVQTVEGPVTCSKCMVLMEKLVRELQMIEANVVSTGRLLLPLLP